MQPKLPPDLARALHHKGLQASCYQPVTLFRKNGRKLPNVAEPEDPWHVVLRRDDCVTWADGATVVQATGDTLRDALERAVAAIPKEGLLHAVSALAVAVDGLKGAIHASQD